VKPLTLKFRLDDVPQGGRPFEGALSMELLKSCLPGLVGDLGYEPLGEAPVSGDVYRSSGGEFIVSAKLDVRARSACVRCLETVELSLALRMDHVYVQRAEAPKAPSEDEELVVDADDASDDTLSYTGDEIDLTDAFREELLLELPMNPVCALVERTCVEIQPAASEADTVDPRWAPLLALRKKMQETAGPGEPPPEVG
jgi:uncharacterized metal-binding protein YceD (DUF177 family)